MRDLIDRKLGIVMTLFPLSRMSHEAAGPTADSTGMTPRVDAMNDSTMRHTRRRLRWLRRHPLCRPHSRALSLLAYGSLLDLSGRFYATRSRRIMTEVRRCEECRARLSEIEEVNDLLTRARVARIAERSTPRWTVRG